MMTLRAAGGWTRTVAWLTRGTSVTAVRGHQAVRAMVSVRANLAAVVVWTRQDSRARAAVAREAQVGPHPYSRFPRRCAGPDSSSSSPASAAPRGTELVQSLKLVSLCLGSQLHGAKCILDPQKALLSSVKVQERSTWKMCISAPGPGPSADLDPVRTKKLRNNVLQLPLCEKIISLNIQRSRKEGLLWASSPPSCCHVI